MQDTSTAYLVHFAGSVGTLRDHVLSTGVPCHALDVRYVSGQHQRVARGQADDFSLIAIMCDSTNNDKVHEKQVITKSLYLAIDSSNHQMRTIGRPLNIKHFI